VNLGTSRIVIIVALIAAGVVVLVSGFDGSTEASGASPTSPPPTETSSPSPTETTSPSGEPTSTPSPQTSDVLIAVMNGTDVAELAQTAQDELTADGYVAPDDPTNAPTQGVETTTVYYRKGANQAQNKSDATYLAETYFPGSKVDKLASAFAQEVTGSVTVVVVLGQDYADRVAA
jgi:hypothetical protein